MINWTLYFFFQAEDGIRDLTVTGVQTCALPIFYQGARKVSVDNIDTFTGNAGGSGTAVPSRFTLPGVGTRVVDPGSGSFAPTAAFTAFNINPYNIFQTPFERFNIYGAANYEVSDAIEV